MKNLCEICGDHVGDSAGYFSPSGFACNDCVDRLVRFEIYRARARRRSKDAYETIQRLERRVADLESGRDRRTIWEAFEGRPAGDDERQARTRCQAQRRPERDEWRGPGR
jgi:hypothetical protein